MIGMTDNKNRKHLHLLYFNRLSSYGFSIALGALLLAGFAETVGIGVAAAAQSPLDAKSGSQNKPLNTKPLIKCSVLV